MRLHPGMIEGHMIGDEVEHQLQPACLQSLAEPTQRLVATQRRMALISGDGEARAADVVVRQVGKNAGEFRTPLRAFTRDLPPSLAGAPDAEKPHPVEAERGDPVEVRVRNVVERRRPGQPPRQVAQPDPRVDLVE